MRTTLTVAEDTWKITAWVDRPRMIGVNFLDLIIPVDRNKVQSALSDAVDHGNDLECITKLISIRAGSPKLVRIDIQNLYPAGVFVAIEDGASVVALPDGAISVQELLASLG